MTQTQRTLDRVVEFDERSRNYPVTAVVSTSTLVSKLWGCNTWNDQGQEGACVGFGFSHELSAEPQPVPTNNTLALNIYNRAKLLDEWAGENYSGTSVLAGAKAVTELTNNVGQKYIGSYRWAFGLRDLVLAVGHVAPVVIGVNWYEGMFDTDAAGYIRKTGAVSGGHCTIVIGVNIVPNAGVTNPTSLSDIDLDKSFATIHNSWGKDWGVLGRARITLRDLGALLDENGDACVPLAMTMDVVTPPPPAPGTVTPAPSVKKSYWTTRNDRYFHSKHPGKRASRTFSGVADAKRYGYRPCPVCRPT